MSGVQNRFNFGPISRDYKSAAVQGIQGPTFTSLYLTLQNQLGAAIQNFFKRHLPKNAVGSDVHKELEAEVWSRLWEQARICNYKPQIKPVNEYIGGIEKYVLYEWYRKNKTLPSVLIPNARIQISVPDLILIEECLEKLKLENPDWFKAYSLVRLEDYSTREAAQEMNKSRNPKIDHNNVYRFVKNAEAFLFSL